MRGLTKWALLGLALMALVHNEILSLIILCVLSFAGLVKFFAAMAEHNIL